MNSEIGENLRVSLLLCNSVEVTQEEKEFRHILTYDSVQCFSFSRGFFLCSFQYFFIFLLGIEKI